jgi:hypothetical protein
VVTIIAVATTQDSSKAGNVDFVIKELIPIPSNFGARYSEDAQNAMNILDYLVKFED